MAQKTLTDSARMTVALTAAAYMRWVEIREGTTPSAQMTQSAIKGFLDQGGFSYEANDPQTIEISALSLSLDTVEAFIQETDVLKEFDRAADRLPRRNSNRTLPKIEHTTKSGR